ncbi:Wadjet anti-phage system protein JetD domain-containing protein, partial [Lapillicoccus sp.]
LTPVEAEVYAALATDALGPAVRLEQERVNFTVAEAALRARLG